MQNNTHIISLLSLKLYTCSLSCKVLSNRFQSIPPGPFFNHLSLTSKNEIHRSQDILLVKCVECVFKYAKVQQKRLMLY